MNKDRMMKGAMGWHMNILAACHMLGAWLVG